MSNFNIGDVVRIGNGKVEYVVASHPTDLKDKTTVESLNTGKAQDVDTARLTLLRSADTEPMNVPQDASPAIVPAEEVEDITNDFDPREDRRQSAYGLAILAAVMRKGANNPKQFAHNSNPLKSVGGKRRKVRARVRAQRTQTRIGNEQYNALYKAYNVQAA